MIRIDDLSFKYKNSDQPALDSINLSIEEGDFVGIIGASGSGKSTLSYALNGIIPHYFQGDYYGKVLVNQMDPFDTEPANLAKIVGSVLQDVESQMTSITVEEEILFGLENFGIDKNEIENCLVETLQLIGIVDLRTREIATLSGGQKQKVAIAAILALKPKVLILDEPTGELDPASSKLFFSVLKELNESFGVTIIIIEQKIMLLCEYVKKLIVMQKGKIILNGNVQDVLKQIDILQNAGVNCPRIVTMYHYLVEQELISQTESMCINVKDFASLLDRNFGIESLTKVNEFQKFINQQLSKQNENTLTSSMISEPNKSSSYDVVSVEHVDFSYDNSSQANQLIVDANFSIKQGEFVSIIGKNGAGKSTLEKLLGGLLIPTNGKVLINGNDTQHIKHSNLAKEVGILFQNPDRLLCRNTVFDEILLGLECTGYSKSDANKRAEQMITEFGFDKDASPFMLSRGERQRLSLACVIAVKPKILILDEPTTGLDYNECMHVMKIVQELNQQGTTVIMICHDMEIVLDFSTRVITMVDGKIINDSTPNQVFTDKKTLRQASLLPPQLYQLSNQLKNTYSETTNDAKENLVTSICTA